MSRRFALLPALLAASLAASAARADDPRPAIVSLELAGDLSGALGELHAALRADPAQARRLGLLYLRGDLLERLGRKREAADAFAASIADEPVLAPYARLRMARLQDQLGHPEVAAGLSAMLIASAPPAALLTSAARLLAETVGRGGDCRVLESVALSRLPDTERRLLQLTAAECRARRGDPSGAAAAWLALLDETPEDGVALAAAESLAAAPADAPADRVARRLGLAFYGHREFDRAIPYLERALAGESPNAAAIAGREELELRYAIGRCHFWQGRYRVAAAAFAEAIRRTHDPDFVQDALYQQARSEELLGDWRSAGHSFRRAAALQEGGLSPLALFSALRLAWRAGREEEGLALLAQLRRDPRHRSIAARAMLFLVASDVVRGRAERAVGWLQAARAAGAPAAEVAYWLGRHAEIRHEPSSAVAAYLDTILPDPSHPLAVDAARRLEAPPLAEPAEALGLRLAEIRDAPNQYAAWILLRGRPAGASAWSRMLDRLAADRRNAPFLDAVALPPASWPLFSTPAAQAEPVILGLGLARDAAPAVLRYFPPDQPALLLAGARLLLESGEPRRAIYAAEVLLQRVSPRVPPRALAPEFRRMLYPLPYGDVIERHAERQNVDRHLLAAILREESRFDSGALSGAAARGMAQFVLPTARRIAAEIGRADLTAHELADPETSIALAARYLANLGRDFPATPLAVVSAYNAGEAQARLWRSYCFSDDPAEYFTKVSFKETRAYLVRVLSSREEYASLDHVPRR